MSGFVLFRRSEAYANRRSKYAWDQADWENETNHEIAERVGLGKSLAASVQAARARKKLAPHTIGRFMGGASHREYRGKP